MSDIRKFSDFFFEELRAKKDFFILPISSTCNSKCLFCSNDSNPFEVVRCGFRKLDEIEKVIWSVDSIDGNIVFNYGVAKLSEGEAMLHPQFFEICNLLRRKYPNTLQISTNGSTLTEETVKKLSQFKPVYVALSMHTINEDNWTQLFKLKSNHYEIAKNSISLLNKYNITYEPRIVAMPSLFGYDDIENTIDFLVNNGTKKIFIVSPSYTDFHPEETINQLRYNTDELMEFVDKMNIKYQATITWLSDPRRYLILNKRFIRTKLERLFNKGVKETYWFTSVAAHERFRDILKAVKGDLNHITNVVVVENKAYGGNIDCTALWMISDIEHKIKELGLNHKHIVLPLNFLDNYGYDLMGRNIIDFIKENTNNVFHFVKI